MTTPNPLEQFFRLPGLDIQLPTGGRFMPEGSIELNAAGMVEVYPMQASDELLLTSPDALMSGVAVEKIIESCIPAIKQPAFISAPDLDVLIIAIRAASNGSVMNMDVTCPKCKSEMEFECDLQQVLGTIKAIPDEMTLRVNADMVIYFKPHSVRDQTKLMLAAYAENRRISALEGQDLSDEQRRLVLSETITKMKDFHTQSLTSAIMKIVVPDHVVTDRTFIDEFVRKAPKDTLAGIKARVEEINTMGIDRTLHVKCQKETCGHEWTTTLEFNPSTFFEAGSSA